MTIESPKEVPKYIQDLNLVNRNKKIIFSEQFMIAAETAKQLEKDKADGQLLSSAEINNELIGFLEATKKYQKKLVSLRRVTRSDLDEMHINDGYPLNSDKRHLFDTLNNTLELVTKYCKDANYGPQARSQNYYKDVEDMLAKEFIECGGDIKISEDSIFMKVLDTFRNFCNIDGFHSDDLNKQHIKRLKDRIRKK